MAGSPAPEKRKRQVHPKTRTGCKTCKIRKVKCGEEKPFCKRCTSTGRKCDGYPSAQPIQVSFLAPAASSSSSSHSSRASSPSAIDRSLALALTQQINTSIPGTGAEKRGFQYFVANTAGELSGYFNEEFWNGFVLRGCWNEAALRHAVVSIGALHEEFERGSGEEGNESFAVNQYSKAMSHLRQTLNPANNNQSPLTALISCVLFVCFDSLRGSFDSAMMHLQSGLKILKELRAQIRTKTKRNGREITKEEEFIIEKYIAPLFERLIVQTILYVDTRTTAEKLVLARELSVEDSNYDTQRLLENENHEDWDFKDLEEAREKLNTTASGLFRMFYVCDGALPMSLQSPLAHTLYTTHSQGVQSWSKAFNSYMAIHTPTLTTKQIRGAALLKIHHTTLEIMRLSAPLMTDPRPVAEAANSASTFRGAAPLFATVVALSKSLILAIEQNGGEGGGKTFSPDLGVVGPLYYTGTKCTVKETRDEALHLLGRWKGREGMWDSGVGGTLVREFWEMEKKFASRGYADNGAGAGEVEFSEALRTDRVRLNLTDGHTWQWRYKKNGNTDDGIFDDGDEDVVVAGGADFNPNQNQFDGGNWVSFEPGQGQDQNMGFDMDMMSSGGFADFGGMDMGTSMNTAGPAPLDDDWMNILFQQQQHMNSPFADSTIGTEMGHHDMGLGSGSSDHELGFDIGSGSGSANGSGNYDPQLDSLTVLGTRPGTSPFATYINRQMDGSNSGT